MDLHGKAHDKGPEASHLVAHNCLADSLLGVLALKGIGHQVLVDEGLRVESILFLELLDFDIVALWLDSSRRHLVVCINGSSVLVLFMCVSMVLRLGIGTIGGELGKQQRKQALMSFGLRCSD
jgi:hypothetical protein